METWKDIVGYESLYRVSDLGNVRSHARQVRTRWGGLRIAPGKSVAVAVHHGGYVICGLMKDGKWKQCLVHRLVLEAFVGPCPDGQESRHGDNNRQNNALSNLCWGTRLENATDKITHGSDPVGVRNGRAELEEKDVLRVVELAKTNTQLDIVEATGINAVTVNHILCGRTWAHLTGIAHSRKYAEVNDEVIADMKLLKAGGSTLAQIAALTGVSKATAFRHTKALT